MLQLILVNELRSEQNCDVVEFREAGMEYDQEIQSTRRRRYVVLCLLIPFVVLGLYFLAFWHLEEPSYLCVSEDGTRFAVVSYVGVADRQRVSIWNSELQRIHTLPTIRSYAQNACLSSSGDAVALLIKHRQADPGVTLEVFDLQNGKRSILDLPTDLNRGFIFGFTNDDQAILIARNRTLAIVPLDPNEKTIVHKDLPIQSFFWISRDNTKLAALGSPTKSVIVSLQIFDVARDKISADRFEPFYQIAPEKPLMPSLLLNSGAMFAEIHSKGENWGCWIDPSGIQETNEPHGRGRLFQTPDQRQIVQIGHDAVHQWDCDTKRFVRTTDEQFHPYLTQLLADDVVLVVPDDDRQDGFGTLRTLNLSTGQTKSVRLQFIDRNRIWFVASTVIAATLIWMSCWVRTGLTSPWRYRAGIDIAILHVIFGATLVCRIVWCGIVSELYIEGGLLIGWLVTLLSFGVLVQVLGTKRAVRYVPWFLFGLAAFYGLLRYDIFELGVVGIVTVVTAVGMQYLFFGVARQFGLRLYRRQPEDPIEPSETKSKITIGDLLLTTAAIAVLAAVARVYRIPDASLMGVEEIFFLLFYGVGVTAIQLSCVWLVFGRDQLWLRSLFVVASVTAVACSALIDTKLLLGKPIPWQVSSWSVAAALAVGSLLILRGHGYRIQHVHSVQKPSDGKQN